MSKPAAVDAVNHSARYALEETVSCADCGKVFSITRSDAETMTVEHSWTGSGENRICIECGYCPGACKHENVRTYESSYVRKSVTPDADGHRTVYQFVSSGQYCLDCGTTLNETITSENVEVFEEHSFVNGKCGYCGYANTCKHDGETDIYYYSEGKRNVKDNGDGTHSFNCVKTEVTYCLECNEDISINSVDKNALVTEEHWMKNGHCTTCSFSDPNAPDSTDEDEPATPSKPGTDSGNTGNTGNTGDTGGYRRHRRYW